VTPNGKETGMRKTVKLMVIVLVSIHVHLENLAKRPEIPKSYLEKGGKAIGEGK